MLWRYEQKWSGIPEEGTCESTEGVRGGFEEEMAFEQQGERGVGICPGDKMSNSIPGREKGQSRPWKQELFPKFSIS